jgi:hypothetical protein
MGENELSKWGGTGSRGYGKAFRTNLLHGGNAGFGTQLAFIEKEDTYENKKVGKEGVKISHSGTSGRVESFNVKKYGLELIQKYSLWDEVKRIDACEDFVELQLVKSLLLIETRRLGAYAHINKMCSVKREELSDKWRASEMKSDEQELS